MTTNRDMDRVLVAAEAVSGDRQKAVEWLTEPLSTFGGKTPQELVVKGRAGDVLAYLESITSGFVG
ncbi:MAG: MbcA/ParS/Xre antitoxin family protein [Bryocella sp.]